MTQDIRHCTKQVPMPSKRDSVGTHWVHVDAKSKGTGLEFVCPNCGLTFNDHWAIMRVVNPVG